MLFPPRVLGVFVGGRSRRMGRPKGLLPAPDTGEALLLRLLRLAREIGLTPVLVGDATPYHALAPEVLRLADQPVGIGPLGGLSALLAHAEDHSVLAVACDMPFLSAPLLARLATTGGPAAVVAPRSAPDAPLEPLCALYDATRVRPVLAAALSQGERSFQRLLRRLEVEELSLSPEESAQLRDWDTPQDLLGSSR
jgi:molybdopterin-guanine dinucleotide biosynthesis protein A